jgi:hypothetical protein
MWWSAAVMRTGGWSIVRPAAVPLHLMEVFGDITFLGQLVGLQRSGSQSSTNRTHRPKDTRFFAAMESPRRFQSNPLLQDMILFAFFHK